MSVYVDDAKNGYGRMKMCHMVADTHGELVKMADQIGVARKWIQKSGSYAEHFDICLAKRQLAVAAGAVTLSTKDIAKILRAKRIAA